MLIDIIAGARPNFVKIAPIIRALEAHAAAGGALRYRLVHTGQHYDAKMSGAFFEQLGIPAPDINLEVGSGTQSEQTAQIMMRYEAFLLKAACDLCLVVGDVTSTMACAIVARKLVIDVAHVEAGIRSGDWSMPEEINRVVTDAITSWFFTTTPEATRVLTSTGISEDAVFFVGNTMIDTLLYNFDRLVPPDFVANADLASKGYIVVTLHRPSNVDDPERFAALLTAILTNTGDMPIVFPVHPRTEKSLALMLDLPDRLLRVGPQSYLEFNWLVKNAVAVITDSGGVTEEATVLRVPCMTLRNSTERPETVTIGTNELLGTDPAALSPALEKLFDGKWKSGDIPEKWDGKTSERIVEQLTRILCRPDRNRPHLLQTS